MSTRISKSNLVQRIVAAVNASGWSAIVLSSQHPFELSLFQGEQRIVVRCYIWNLTHGGYPRNPNELRIQVTGVDRFRVDTGVKTLLLGWDEDEQLFAGFDVRKHLVSMTGRSPSLQVRRETLDEAKTKSFFPQTRDNDEIVIVFRPEFFVAYVQEIDELHKTAQWPEELRQLEGIANADIERELNDVPPGPRRTVLVQINRKVRDARFRTNVLNAYNYRCAISGVQLGLVEAAHIVPVDHERGTDELKNGICLSALHHRAFDAGLVGIKRDYSIIVNERRMSDLRSIGWDGGAAEFRSSLRDRILLPTRQTHYPDRDYLLLGEELRGWPHRYLV
ncbi:MAG TPA: HNH endonuclease [Candidatus Baltobacteraceae bacterium]|jgi:putative restriction endonuclease|nr:HNH endonuclease [Candidatus Baltobacteraceae bacterium]